MLTIILFIIIAIVCLGGGYFLRKYLAEKKIQDAEAKAKFVLDKANKEISDRRREMELEAKDLMFRLRRDFENETKERRQELAELEKRFSQREINLDRRLELLERKEKEFESRAVTLNRQAENIKLKENQLLSLISEEKERLQKISSC